MRTRAFTREAGRKAVCSADNPTVGTAGLAANVRKRMDAEALFRQNLATITRTAESICRRNGVTDHDAEDFAADVRLRLCENDYAVIRKFQGKSSFATFLTVVITKRFLDHRRALWGKWSPSSQARRLGPVAIQLETLVYRDGCSFDAACRVLEQKPGLAVDRRELQTMLAQLPRRVPRRLIGSDGLEDAASTAAADSQVLDAERHDRLAAAERALREALRSLPDEDRTIIRLLSQTKPNSSS
jgi:RNA polymerase sigma factor (sigma-70 family)